MPSVNLLDVLKIDVILENVAPYLPFPAIQDLSSINKQARTLLRDNPSAYRRLDLGVPQGTERSVFQGLISSQRGLRLLTYARILILDHQIIDGDFLRDLLLSGTYQVRILSLVRCIGIEDNEISSIIKLLSLHAELIPAPQRLRGIYRYEYSTVYQLPIGTWMRANFNPNPDPVPTGTEQDFYSTARPNTLNVQYDDSSLTMQISSSRGHLMYNAVLCRGPRHDFRHPDPVGAKIAGYIIGPQGCSNCETLPEGPASDLQTHFPLINPPPFHSFSVEAAAKPPYGADGKPLHFFARCWDCAKEGSCDICNKFFCENCNETAGGPKAPIDWPDGVQTTLCVHCSNPCVACRRATFVPCKKCNILFCKYSVEGVGEMFNNFLGIQTGSEDVELVSPDQTSPDLLVDDFQCYNCIHRRIDELRANVE